MEGEEGGGRGGEEEGVGGRRAKLKTDAERLSFWTWEIFAGSGYWEHENVKQTGKPKPLYVLIFVNPGILSKGFQTVGTVYLRYALSITGPFWLCPQKELDSDFKPSRGGKVFRVHNPCSIVAGVGTCLLCCGTGLNLARFSTPQCVSGPQHRVTADFVVLLSCRD